MLKSDGFKTIRKQLTHQQIDVTQLAFEDTRLCKHELIHDANMRHPKQLCNMRTLRHMASSTHAFSQHTPVLQPETDESRLNSK